MKELSIEQKAKRYDEAIEKAKSKIKDDKDHVLYEYDVIDIFPELAESENERIRKFLIGYFDKLVDENSEWGLKQETRNKIVAWLEKQGEQKPDKWNKNDEVLLDETLHFIREFQQSDRCIDEGDMQNSVTCENWLKSLKDRYTWKPSDEQIEALVSAIDVMIDNRGAGDKKTILLSGLYHELKTL